MRTRTFLLPALAILTVLLVMAALLWAFFQESPVQETSVQETPVRVYGVATHEAGSGGVIPVFVQTHGPVVLILSSLQSVRWDIRADANADIRAIIVGGKEPQQVDGVDHLLATADPGTPFLEFHTEEPSTCAGSGCVWFADGFYAYDIHAPASPLLMTASGLVITEETWLDIMQRDSEVLQRRNPDFYNGSYAISSITLNDTGIELVIPEAETERIVQLKEYTREHNVDYLRRQQDLKTPIVEEPIPRTFAYEPLLGSGYGGENRNHAFTFGRYGHVYDMDGFLRIDGMDLNGDAHGTAGQFSADALPAGVKVIPEAQLSLDGENLSLTYTINNTSFSALQDVSFSFFLDPETVYGGAEAQKIDENRTDEYGVMSGTVGSGPDDPDPDSWEIDEPEYYFGNIITNLLLDMLENTNNVSEQFLDDPSYALSFQLGTIAPLSSVPVTILLSTKGDTLGSLALSHHDVRLTDVLTISGRSGYGGE